MKNLILAALFFGASIPGLKEAIKSISWSKRMGINIINSDVLLFSFLFIAPAAISLFFIKKLIAEKRFDQSFESQDKKGAFHNDIIEILESKWNAGKNFQTNIVKPFLPHIVSLIISEKNNELAKHLTTVSKNSLGFETVFEDNLKIAKLLIETKRQYSKR